MSRNNKKKENHIFTLIAHQQMKSNTRKKRKENQQRNERSLKRIRLRQQFRLQKVNGSFFCIAQQMNCAKSEKPIFAEIDKH